MFIPAAIEESLTLRLPQFFCCNCGEAENLRAVTTPLTVIRYVPGGSALTLELELPYCTRCVRSARREPVGLIKKLLIAAILALTLGLLAIIAPTPGMPRAIGEHLFYFTAAAALVSVFGLYSLQKPTGRQTSYYQPVRLKRIKPRFSGRIEALTLAFTHTRYGEAFATANKEAIASGALQVELFEAAPADQSRL